MATSTRSDKNITNKIKTLLDSMGGVSKEQKIEITKQIFAILSTTPGITFVKKYPKLYKAVKDKLVELSKEKEIVKLTKEWHQQIFGEPIPEPEPESEPESEPEPDNNDYLLEEWIDEVTVSAPLTRERRDFLGKLYEVLEDLAFTRSQKWIYRYSEELWEILSTDYGKATIKMFPELRTYLENELYEEYNRENGEFWEDYWPDIFGCEIECDCYYE